MKKLLLAAVTIVAGTLLFAAAAMAGGHDEHGGRHFSNASLHGTYVVKFEGTNSGGGGTLGGASLAPEHGVGLLVADGKGNFTGTETANILLNTDGVPTGSPPSTAVCTVTLTGTYTVNPDGTGTTTATAVPVSSDPRCGPAGGFTTTNAIVLQSSNDLVFVGTDFDSTVGGQATRQGGFGE